MEVSITQPLGFSQLGSRTNNEDTLFPDPKVTTPDQQWFMVCDGVGGAERGEVASQLAAMEFDLYFRENPVTTVTEAYIQQALSYVQDKFDEYVADNPQAESMGTTLTLVYRHQAGITVAHLGDSRVYLVRKGIIEWRTDDHSYVNELVKAGVLNPDEARRHPQRNVITRAIQSGDKRVKADVQLLNDLDPGDYLFMCTDGILERISDELLEKTLGGNDSNEEKLRTLLACCYGQTRDNFTAYLLQVASVKNKVATSARIALPTYARPEADDEEDAVTLIGVPRPEALPSYASLSAQNDVPPRRESVTPVVEMRTPTESKATLDPKPVVSKPSSVGRWLPWMLVVILLGGGSYALWYKYGYMLDEYTSEQNVSENSSATTAGPPAKTVTIGQPTALTNEKQTDKSNNSVEETGSDPSGKESGSSATTKTDLTVKAQGEKEPVSNSQDGNVTIKVSNPYLNLEVVEDKRGQLGLRWITVKKGEKEIFAPKFQKISLKDYKYGLIPVELKGQKKIVSQQGVIYDKMGTISQKCGRIPVQKGDTWAYLNLNGNQIIKPGKYKLAKSFDEKNCTAEVKDQTGKVYHIDSSGNRQDAGAKTSNMAL